MARYSQKIRPRWLRLGLLAAVCTTQTSDSSRPDAEALDLNIPSGQGLDGSFGLRLPELAAAEAASIADEAPSPNVALDLLHPSFEAGSSMLENQGWGKDLLSSSVRHTVIRITSLVQQLDWFEPYRSPQVVGMVGSGFVIPSLPGGEANDEKGGPSFITNAHVVRDAADVSIQLAGFAQESFKAYVPLICEDFDLAVLRLIEPEKFVKALAKNNGTPLPMKLEPLELGLEVASLGFPLASETPKLSIGNIAGSQDFDGTTVYQTTAPISPGNSGGPLFAKGANGKLEVVGVTFASAAASGAQNMNYVIPTTRILQVLNHLRNLDRKQRPELEKLMKAFQAQLKGGVGLLQGNQGPEQGGMPNFRVLVHDELRIPPLDAVAVEANKALYDSSGGCREGVFISRIEPTSVLAHTSPKRVPDRSFLVKVNGVPLDQFGTGRTNQFTGDLTPFLTLMLASADLSKPVDLTICKDGHPSIYKTSMVWKDAYETRVPLIWESRFAPAALDYEAFAGVVVMGLTLNHVIQLISNGQHPELGHYLLPHFQQAPQLLVTHVEPGAYASKVLAPGMLVKRVNNVDVSNLTQYRKVFEPASGEWSLETEQGALFAVDFQTELKTQIVKAASVAPYLATPALRKAAQILISSQRAKDSPEPSVSEGQQKHEHNPEQTKDLSAPMLLSESGPAAVQIAGLDADGRDYLAGRWAAAAGTAAPVTGEESDTPTIIIGASELAPGRQSAELAASAPWTAAMEALREFPRMPSASGPSHTPAYAPEKNPSSLLATEASGTTLAYRAHAKRRAGDAGNRPASASISGTVSNDQVRTSAGEASGRLLLPSANHLGALAPQSPDPENLVRAMRRGVHSKSQLETIAELASRNRAADYR